MKKASVIAILLLLTACHMHSEATKRVNMYNASGDMIGTVELSEGDGAVNFAFDLEGLETGLHGVQVHEYARCDPPNFKTAGNHFDPGGNEHGLMHPEGSHLGDLPNIEADEDGKVQDTELELDEATLLSGKNSLLEGEGTSLIIHKKADDGISQPGGNAGSRVACGLISKGEKKSTETPSDPTERGKEQKEKD